MKNGFQSSVNFMTPLLEKTRLCYLISQTLSLDVFGSCLNEREIWLPSFIVRLTILYITASLYLRVSINIGNLFSTQNFVLFCLLRYTDIQLLLAADSQIQHLSINSNPFLSDFHSTIISSSHSNEGSDKSFYF